MNALPPPARPALARLAPLVVLSALLVPARAPAARPEYPETPVHEVADTLHGQVLVDPYRWLEDGTSPAVQAWSAAQNELTRGVLDRFPGRDSLAAQLSRLYGVTVTTAPRVHGRRLFYSRRSGGQNQPVVLLAERGAKGAARVAIDPNTLSADGTVALDWMYPSHDGAFIAYGTSPGGSEHSTLSVRDVASGKDLRDEIPNTQHASVAWDRDGLGFLYSRHPVKGEVPDSELVFHERIFHHRLGADPARDSLVFGGEGRPYQESRGVSTSSDHRFVFLTTSLDWAKNDLYYRRSDAPGAFAPIAVGLDGTTQADAFGGRVYLLTNVGAPRYRIVTTDPATPGPARWKDVVPQQQGVIEDFAIVGGKLVVRLAENAISRLLIFSTGGTLEKEVPLPTLGAVTSLAGDPGGHEIYFTFTSFVYPSSVFRYDLANGMLAPLEKPRLEFDPAAYETRLEWCRSKDGTRVPLFVVHRRGLAMDGDRPTILTGYGGFNISETPAYRANFFPWLDRGGVVAQACLRGGGEFGREWHEAGRLARKQNVFDDFHAAAEWLVSSGITSPRRLAALGGSNGGLLVGAALTQRPDLFGAIVCQAPLLDMIRYQRFLIARYWVPEYGSSEDPEQFRYLYAYSPYQNVRAGVRYPATLLTTAEEDSRVDPLHARKMAALLQARSAGDAPLLIRIESRAGHGAGKPTSKRIAEAADVLAFLMMELGVN